VDISRMSQLQNWQCIRIAVCTTVDCPGDFVELIRDVDQDCCIVTTAELYIGKLQARVQHQGLFQHAALF